MVIFHVFVCLPEGTITITLILDAAPKDQDFAARSLA